VDFPVYPRKFVKTEYKGVSLMDIGTGSVLFSSALVARHTRTKESLSKRIPQAVLSGLPLWVIGIGKFLVHASVDYQEHVSEYGVHWNFFMSLGFVSLLSAVLDLDGFSSLGFSVLVMVLYQGCLFYGLEEFILSAPRDGFFSMNREGICGCVGFFCIYQIGVGLKRFVLVPGKEGKRLAGFTGFFVFISYLIGGESRRLVISIQTNLGYVFWVVGHNLFSLLSLWLVERSSLLPITNEVLDSINFNQLPYFMISNLATGIVNLSMQTIFASDLTGFLVVVLYQLIVLSILWTLKVFKIRVKKW
jgi:phosphatidylinositol glycan class W